MKHIEVKHSLKKSQKKVSKNLMKKYLIHHILYIEYKKMLAVAPRKCMLYNLNDRYYTSIYTRVCVFCSRPFLFENKDKKVKNV